VLRLGWSGRSQPLTVGQLLAHRVVTATRERVTSPRV
jgi:hypothetical protein